MSVLRGKPRHSSEIAQLLNQVNAGAHLSRMDIMAAFGEKAFLLFQVGESLQGLIAWQVENLVSLTHDIVLNPSIPPEQALPLLFNEMEKASKDLQAEAALVFVPDALTKFAEVWKGLGYAQRDPASLGVTAWQQAAQDAQPESTVLFFKQLRVDRVLRPM
jgi:dephospho-CoA kinase